MKFFSVFILATFFAGPTFAQSTQQERDRMAIDQLGITVRFLANLNLRCNTKRDCEVLPMGSKACGGPSEFVVTSRYNPNRNVMEDLVQNVTQKEEEYNHRYRVMSDCGLVRKPEVKCVWKKCNY